MLIFSETRCTVHVLTTLLTFSFTPSLRQEKRRRWRKRSGGKVHSMRDKFGADFCTFISHKQYSLVVWMVCISLAMHQRFCLTVFTDSVAYEPLTRVHWIAKCTDIFIIFMTVFCIQFCNEQIMFDTRKLDILTEFICTLTNTNTSL